MRKARLFVVIGIGPKRPICRDTLAATERESKRLAVHSIRELHDGCDDCARLRWRTLESWGYRCVRVTLSYAHHPKEK